MRSFPMIDAAVSRRLFLIGAGVASAGATLPAIAALADSRTAADAAKLDTPKGMLDTYVRISGDTSGKPYVGCYSGHLFAVQPDNIVEPLCGFTGFGLGWDQPQADGSYHHSWKEAGYYTDLRSGQVLEQWRNPLNDELCDVMHIHNRSVNMTLTTTVRLPPPGANVKVGYGNFSQLDNPAHPYGLPYAIIDDQLSVFSDARAYVPNPLDPKVWVRESAGPMLSVAEFFMLTSKKDQALDPRVSNANCTGSWTRIGPWLPWMLLGARPGHLFYRSSTKKLHSMTQLPAVVRDYTAKRYPEFLEFPKDFGMPMESSWEVFKRERKPHS